MKLKLAVLVGVFIMICGAGTQALAHNVWINVENPFPKVGESVDIGIGWGHTYPKDRLDQEMKPGNLAYIRVLDPDGVEVKPERISETAYKLNVEKEGAYLVTAGIKKGVFTKTPKGREWSDKKGVKHPISCTSFSIDAKSVIISGAKDKNLQAVTGQELEVIPLSNPQSLKAGESMSMKVMFRGQAVSGVTVNAAYAGFSEEESGGDIAPHREGKGKEAKGKGHRFPVSVLTGPDGKATLAFTQSGYWIVTISHKTPYPDKETCDEYMHNMAFTLEIR